MERGAVCKAGTCKGGTCKGGTSRDGIKHEGIDEERMSEKRLATGANGLRSDERSTSNSAHSSMISNLSK